MGAWIQDEVWRHRAVRSLDLTGRYLVARLFGMCDQWGRFEYDPQAIADETDADDDDVTRTLEALAANSRPFIVRYGERFGCVVGWDQWQSNQFLRDRSLPKHPPVPLDVWTACKSSDVWRLNRDGDRVSDGTLWVSGSVLKCPEVSGSVRECPDTSGHVRACPEVPGQLNSTQPNTTQPKPTPSETRAHVGTPARDASGYDVPDIVQQLRPAARQVLAEAGIHGDLLDLAADAICHGSETRRNGAHIARDYEPPALARRFASVLAKVQANAGAHDASGTRMADEAAAAEGRAMLDGLLRAMLGNMAWPTHKTMGWFTSEAETVRKRLRDTAAPKGQRAGAGQVRMCGSAPRPGRAVVLTPEQAAEAAARINAELDAEGLFMPKKPKTTEGSR
jgi:hypothetical protein